MVRTMIPHQELPGKSSYTIPGEKTSGACAALHTARITAKMHRFCPDGLPLSTPFEFVRPVRVRRCMAENKREFHRHKTIHINEA